MTNEYKMVKYTFNEAELILFEDGTVYRKLEGFKDGNAGYIKYAFNKKRIFAHQLMATVFLENKENKKYVNHKDGKKDNNSVSNLEWCTASENQLHSYRTLKRKTGGVFANPLRGLDHYKATPIIQLSTDGVIIREWGSLTLAAEHFNISHSGIVNVLKGRAITCVGYLWRYKNKDSEYKTENLRKSFEIILEGTGEVYKSMYDAALKNGISYSGLNKALYNNRSIKGKKFKFL